MFHVLVLFCFIFVGLADDIRPVIHLPELINDIITQSAYACTGETGAEQKVAKRVFLLHFDKDDLSKKFLYCLSNITGFGNPDGHLTEELMKLYEDSEYKEDVRRVFERCNEIQRKERIQTMHEVVKCFATNTPVILGEKV